MVIVGAFLGGPDTTLEAGSASISLSINTTDRLNLDTASWTITAPGFSQTVQADASGRGYIVVPSGKTYTVTLVHSGQYENDGPQQVITESKMNYGVLFDLFSYQAISTLLSVTVTMGSDPVPGVPVTASKDGKEITGTTNGNGVASLRGLDAGTWIVSLDGYGQSKEVTVDMLAEDISFEVGSLDVTTVPDEATVTISGPITMSKATSGKRVLFGPLPQGQYTVSTSYESKTVSVEITQVSVKIYTRKATTYGFKIEESTSDPYGRVTYTDDAIGIQPASGHSLGGWANTELFQGIKPVVRKKDGTFKDMNKRDISKCTDGSVSEIFSTGNDAFVEIPRWYIHEHKEGKTKYVKICKLKLDDSYHAMHAMDNGVLRDCFHVGCYGSYYSGFKMYSSCGKTPTRNKSTQDFAKYCQARGAGFDQFSWFPWNFVCALFVLAYKTCNSQAVFKGYVNGGSVQAENRTSFDNDFGLAGSSSGTEQMSFLWIQNLWGNMYQLIGGAKTNAQNQLMVILDGKDCTVNDSDFTVVGSGGSTEGIDGYVSEMDLSDSKVGFFPKATSGSSTTHWCDYGHVYPSRVPHAGGNYDNGDYAGPFDVYFDLPASSANPYVGSRLMYKGGRP